MPCVQRRELQMRARCLVVTHRPPPGKKDAATATRVIQVAKSTAVFTGTRNVQRWRATGTVVGRLNLDRWSPTFCASRVFSDCDDDVDAGSGLKPGLSVRTTAQRYPQVGSDGVLVYSDDDNDSFRDLRSPPRATPKKGADKRVSPNPTARCSVRGRARRPRCLFILSCPVSRRSVASRCLSAWCSG